MNTQYPVKGSFAPLEVFMAPGSVPNTTYSPGITGQASLTHFWITGPFCRPQKGNFMSKLVPFLAPNSHKSSLLAPEKDHQMVHLNGSTKAYGQIARITWQYSLTIKHFQLKLNSHELMALQSITIQPKSYGHIAVQLWSHKFLAIQPNKIGYIVENFRLDSQNLMAIQLGYRYSHFQI